MLRLPGQAFRGMAVLMGAMMMHKLAPASLCSGKRRPFNSVDLVSRLTYYWLCRTWTASPPEVTYEYREYREFREFRE